MCTLEHGHRSGGFLQKESEISFTHHPLHSTSSRIQRGACIPEKASSFSIHYLLDFLHALPMPVTCLCQSVSLWQWSSPFPLFGATGSTIHAPSQPVAIWMSGEGQQEVDPPSVRLIESQEVFPVLPGREVKWILEG